MNTSREKDISKKILNLFIPVVVGDSVVIGLIGAIGIATRMNIFVALAIMVLAAAAFIPVSIALGRNIARSSDSVLHKIAKAAESISKGDLKANIDFESSEETVEIADSFRKIMDSLGHLKQDAERIASGASEGRLEVRVDSSSHSGVFREIAEDMNQTVACMKEPLDASFTFIRNMSDGVHQEDMKHAYKGVFAELADNLNEERHSLSILLGETAKLEEAGQNGDLTVKGDEQKLKGYYAGIVKGINSTFDSIKAPIAVALDFIEKAANGDDMELLENPYKGDFATLIDDLNSVRETLYFLLTETGRLAEEGVAGNLNVRGDADKLKGHYKDVIYGINQTLDSVVTPLVEASTVLNRMAENDFTTRMSDNYKGMIRGLSESTNKLSERLVALEKVFENLSVGDISALEAYKKLGKRSENDKIMPNLILEMTAIRDLVETADKMAIAASEGNLSTRGDENRFEGGYRQIIASLNQTLEAVSAPIEESSQVLQELAEGNLTAEMAGEYRGEYNLIKESLNKAIQSFNVLLGEIRNSASQVAIGSRQVSDASQSLSQGAAEQASSVEELTSSITQVASQTKQNAENATLASELSLSVKTEAAQGNEQMGMMLGSMHEINESSTNISKIIKVIDDIAFQTNILALNAAVEAARAGQYGKGFAVVAEEVRNLAAKSADAAKNTTALIEGSISKVEAGTKIANETAQKLGKISESVQKCAEIVGGIAVASNEQATAIAQIDRGIEQVSAVVQTNSATAEESAASSEELSGQADMLNQLVENFKLKSDGVGQIAAQTIPTRESTKYSLKQAAVAKARVPAGVLAKY
ncbi:MAG: methyl-accepting chemotaxis protein [Clostridia bacterium]|nr:methyl-accepting chemotaxis protein [Clostridia bacterium]